MLGRFVVAGLMLAALAAAVVPAHATVNVNVGMSLGAPPQLVVVPGTPVAYAPAVPANYFYYGGQYYLFSNGVWYLAPAYNGPWVVLAPLYVPRPLLMVPVRYYHAAPPAWRHWRREEPPRWAQSWGHEWSEPRPPGHRYEDRRDHH